MKRLRMAYLFWLPSLFGVAGLHRIYMGKIGTGLLWLFTGGLLGIGTIYDAVTMPDQLDTVNRDRFYSRFLDEDDDRTVYRRVIVETVGPGKYQEGNAFQGRRQVENPEQILLRLAQRNGGSVSPAQLALDANISADDARAQLESMVNRGYAELRVRKSGALAYVFPEFLTPETSSQFENLT